MFLKSSSFLTAVYYLIFFIVNFLTLNHSLALSELSNEISINCGSSTIFNGNDGRKWIGDIGSKLLVNYQNSQAKSIRSKLSHFSDTIPYTTARISYKQFSYEIDVGLGQKFIRLYFYPTMYKGFERSNDFFTVKAGPFTLLSNFSASLTVDALGVRFLMKEFCINVEEHQLLTVTFSPSTGADKGKAYAFVNGIEIISMPSGLYYTPVDEPAMQVVGKKHQLSVDEGIALEMVYRLNIGGISIPSIEDTGLFREWGDDSNYLVNSDVRPVSTSNKIKYKSIANYTAPQKVYQTSWATVLTKQVDKVDNFTWKLPLDSGFRYLIRFHFCELEYDIEENSHLRFSILINNQVAEANVDLIKWSGGSGIAISKNYVAVMEGDRMEGKRQLLISLTPKWSNNEEWWTESSDTILKGLEVFKLSNTDYNLAGVNPVPLTQALSSSIRTPRKFVYANGGSSISTIIIVLISLVSIIVYQLRIRGEKYGDDKISISPSKGVSRHFSLAEIRTATNNFDKMLVIGKGGFGLVYKGVINCGAITVALKRLNSKSNQGAIEFWTEIDMLSKLRHTHLVSLLGYCDEDGEMILVYEYMENGTLADHLHKISSNGGDDLNLSWEQRLKICIGAARGLDYLHTGTQHGVIHRDVKTTNILLDDKLVAKISDFGLCKVGPTSHSYTHVSTNVKGTFGYFDPEYFLTHRLTTKSDVYAFGVVLLEVLSGRRAVDLSFGEDQSSLVFWAQQCIKEGKINELIGPSLRDQISSSCLKIFTEVACKCLHNRPNGRPTMFDVVVSLEGALTSQNCMSDIVQLDGALQQGTIPSSTTHIRDVENIRQEKKISKGMLVNAFQWSLRLLTKKSSGSTSDDEKNNHHLSYRRFTIKEIRAATNNFNSNLRIDEDSFGTMYKGRIDRGTLKVMIKSTQKPLEVDKLLTPRAEIKSQSQLNHPNILSLLGYCADKDNLMLVYNYMVNRSLDYNLFKVRLHDPLPWTKRLEICIGAAKGLQYLHYGTTEQIIHRDVKPSNILLDENWVAKISGFELSKVAVSDHMSTCVPGTSGLLDPEYASTGHLTKKTDVYAFGGVLLEVLCARKPYRPSQDEEKFSLVRWFRTCIQRKKINQLIDPYLIGRISPECLMQYLKVAWDCLLDQGAKRPTMNSVVQNLQIALQLQQIWHTDCIPSVNGRVYNDKLASQHSSFFDHSGIYVQGEGQVIACHSIEEWKENLEKNNDKLVVVDFFASWCGPCRVIAPFLAELAKKLPNVTFLKVDVDELQAVAEEMKVEAMPTFLFMMEGKVVDTVVGAVKEKLQQTISKHSGSASALEQNPF